MNTDEPKHCKHCKKQTVLYRFRMTNDFLCWDCNWEWRLIKMDSETSIAVISALKYKLENKDCKVNLTNKTYAEALNHWVMFR